MIRHGTAQMSVAEIPSAAAQTFVPDRDIEAESTFVALPPGAKARDECLKAARFDGSPTTSSAYHATTDITFKAKSP